MRRAVPHESGAINALRRLLDAKSLARYGTNEVSLTVALENRRRAET